MVNKKCEQIILLALEIFCKHKLYAKQRNKIETFRKTQKIQTTISREIRKQIERIEV